MSYASISAVLALDGDISSGERLAAFSLASFANGDHRAWPGTRVAAVRAGLSRSQYLAARDSLVRRGLVSVEAAGGGRGKTPTVFLDFVAEGNRLDADLNAPLFEAVLSFSPTKGSARLLLAALAALASTEGRVANLSTDELRSAAGLADSTYRRARAALLADGEVAIEEAGGGRSKTNTWIVSDPRALGAPPLQAGLNRTAPPPTARPLAAAVRPNESTADANRNGPELNGVLTENPAQSRMVFPGNGPDLGGVSAQNPAESRTVTKETPPQTPPQTPPPYARTGSEPQNHPTVPPNPPAGGHSSTRLSLFEDYITERGRQRQRTVTVPFAEAERLLGAPSVADREDWLTARTALARCAGESTFQLWLSELQLIAVSPERQLILTAPEGKRSWIRGRYGRLIDRVSAEVRREVRLAEDREIALHHALENARGNDITTYSSTDSEEAI